MAALTFLLAHLLFLHLLAGEPWLGVVFYRRLRAKLQVDPRARASYYRLLLASTTLPALPVWAIGAASALLFAVGHAYQGKAGIIQTGAAGAAFFALYALTGSLVPAIVLHALADLRVLALLPSREAAPTEAGRRV